MLLSHTTMACSIGEWRQYLLRTHFFDFPDAESTVLKGFLVVIADTTSAPDNNTDMFLPSTGPITQSGMIPTCHALSRVLGTL